MKNKPQYRVLLVEAEDEDWMRIQRWLKESKELDFDTVWACSYADAKSYLIRRKPDVILSGYRLGKNRTGLDLANWLWARGDGIPLILINSGEIQGTINQESLCQLVTDCLPKSGLSPKSLEQNISRLMGV